MIVDMLLCQMHGKKCLLNASSPLAKRRTAVCHKNVQDSKYMGEENFPISYEFYTFNR